MCMCIFSSFTHNLSKLISYVIIIHSQWTIPSPENTHHGGKYHCMAGLQFKSFD